MKRLALLFCFFVAPVFGQTSQSISLPKFVPVHCDGRVAGSCAFAVYPNTTGIMMAAETAAGNGTVSVTDSLGNSWQRDYCDVQGDCLWRMNFGSNIPIYGKIDTITISPNYWGGQGYDTFLFLYDGIWTFTGQGSSGSYRESSPWPQCYVGSDCDRNWTGMIYAEAGEMLILWDNSRNSTIIPKPAPGWNIEATDHVFTIADMIAPVENVYIGALVQKTSNGSDTGGTHWEMGIAAYTKDKSN